MSSVAELTRSILHDANRALQTFRLLQGVALIDTLARSPDMTDRSALQALSRAATNYHAYLLGFSPRLHPPVLLLGLDDTADASSPSVSAEIARLHARFAASLRSPGGRALVEFVRGYYGIAQLDGYRAAYWFARVLRTASSMAVLPPMMQEVRGDLDAMIDGVRDASARRPQREIYSCCQSVADYLTPLLKLDCHTLDAIGVFALSVPEPLLGSAQ